MKTIYLAKANTVNPEFALLVKSYLLDMGFQINQFQGGAYDVMPLLSSDILVVICDANSLKYPSESDDNIATIGKGIFTEIDRFYKNGNPCRQIIMIQDGDLNFAYRVFATDEGKMIIDTNNWIQGYGQYKLYRVSDSQCLRSYLERASDDFIREALFHYAFDKFPIFANYLQIKRQFVRNAEMEAVGCVGKSRCLCTTDEIQTHTIITKRLLLLLMS